MSKKKQVLYIFSVCGLITFFSTKVVNAQLDPPKNYPIANCTAINAADRRFYEMSLDSWWGGSRPPNNFEAYTTRLWQGNVQELVFGSGKVWLRTGVGEDVSTLQGKTWTSYDLSFVWGNTTNHPPYSNISSASYVIYDGLFMEQIISGSTVWYRSSQTPGQYDFSTTWNSAPLSQAWGADQNPPGFNGVDEHSYRVMNGVIEELVIQGENLYRRIGRNKDARSLPKSWTNYKISNIWGRSPNPPTTSPDVLNYQLEDNDLREVVIRQGTYYYRDCRDYPDAIYDSSLRMIDTFLYYYSDNTDYTTMINATYSNTHLANGAFRSLMTNAIAHTARYQISQNQFDRNKALNYIRATLNNFNKWKESWLSAVATRDFLLGSWYWWNDLTAQEKVAIKNLAVTQANYLADIFDKAVKAYRDGNLGSADYQAVSGYIDDTKAEENGAAAEALSFISQMFSDDPESIIWEYYARCYAFHTITASVDSENCFIDTQTVYDDYTLDNHGFHPSPVYTLAGIASLQQGELAYYFNGTSRPSEFRHNISNLWLNFHNYYYPYPASPPSNSFAIKPEYNPGSDWGDTHITLAMPEFSYTGLFGGGGGSVDYTRLENFSVNFFDDWWYKTFTRYQETSPVSSMPVYTQAGTTLRWGGNGLSHGKGAGEIILYHQLNEGKLNLKNTSRSPEAIKEVIRNINNNSNANQYDVNSDENINSFDLDALMSVY